jgi:N-acetylglucosaminyldiphosphoundecaprenol N-acetyl-beta-D-mannosaminyltransferase
VLGHPVDSLTLDEAVDAVDAFVRSARPHRIAVVNAHKFWLMERYPALRRVVHGADLILPEWAVVWAAARLGRPLRGHVAGITLVDRLIAVAPARGWSFYFLGAAPDVIAAMVERLRVARPGLQVAGWHHGYYAPEDEPVVVEAVRRTGPDILVVALGSPRQELWIAAHGPRTGARVAIGVGGSFDVLSGRKRDAPAWMRGRGLEWLYRLWLDPRRLWRRYLVTNTWFVWRVLRAWLGQRVPGGRREGSAS